MTQPIRVLHMMGSMNRGGLETLVMEFFRHIDRSKVLFDFFSYSYSDTPSAYEEEARNLGGRIYKSKKRVYTQPITYRKELVSFFKAHPEYRIVHAHMDSRSGFLLSPAKAATNPCTIAHSHLAHAHYSRPQAVLNAISRRMLKKSADFGFACSQDACEYLFGVSADNKKYYVVNNAIDIEKFAFNAESRQAVRQELGVSDSSVLVGYTARMFYQKNHELFIRIFSELVKMKQDAHAVLVGDGPLKDAIKNLAISLGVENRVHFLGVRSDVPRILSALDVFLMPSRFEGLGIVLVEAQANGLPCVITADAIPEEADVGAGLITRVAIEDTPLTWAQNVVSAGNRLDPMAATQAVRNAQYDIQNTTAWLQDFYLSHWSDCR